MATAVREPDLDEVVGRLRDAFPDENEEPQVSNLQKLVGGSSGFTYALDGDSAGEHMRIALKVPPTEHLRCGTGTCCARRRS